MEKVKIVNQSNYPLPEYKTQDSSGLDLYANIDTSITLNPLERVLIPNGIWLAIPKGFEAQVRPRSGLALKHGITVLNTPGTIDSDFRGQIQTIIVNLSNQPYTINPGDRIAQIVFAKVEHAEFIVVESLDETERGSGGFGSTGKK